MQRRRFDELVSFPCNFTFKVVGTAEGDFAATIASELGAVLGRKVETPLTTRRSAGGKYESVTLHIHVVSGDEVYAVYAALGELPQVRFVL